MLSSKNTDRKALINDLTKNACLMIVVHILTNTRANKKLFDEETVNGFLFTLLAIVFYHIVFVNFVPPLK
jgi:hypothetical protein